MNKKYILAALLSSALTAANAKGVITITPSSDKVLPGETVDVIVSMTNEVNEIRGLDVDFELPEGLTLVGTPSHNAARFAGFRTPVFDFNNDGTSHVAFMATGLKYVSGTEGEIFRFTVKADENLTEDKLIELAMSVEVNYDKDDENVTPVASINVVQPAPALDFVASVVSDEMSIDGEAEIVLALENTKPLQALQLELALPNGLQVVEKDGTVECDFSNRVFVSENLDVTSNHTSANNVRFVLIDVASDSDNPAIPAGKGAILTFKVKATDALAVNSKVEIKNIKLSEYNGTQTNAGNLSVKLYNEGLVKANQAAAQADLEKLEGYQSQISALTYGNEEFISPDVNQCIETWLGDTYPTLIQQALEAVAEGGVYESPIKDAQWEGWINDVKEDIAVGQLNANVWAAIQEDVQTVLNAAEAYDAAVLPMNYAGRNEEYSKKGEEARAWAEGVLEAAKAKAEMRELTEDDGVKGVAMEMANDLVTGITPAAQYDAQRYYNAVQNYWSGEDYENKKAYVEEIKEGISLAGQSALDDQIVTLEAAIAEMGEAVENYQYTDAEDHAQFVAQIEALIASINDVVAAADQAKVDEAARVAENQAAAEADMAKLEELQAELTAIIKDNEDFLTPDDNDIINDILGDTWPMTIQGAWESVEKDGVYESPINWEQLEANVAEVAANIAAAKQAEADRQAANLAAAEADLARLEELQAELSAIIKGNDDYLTPDDIDVVSDILGDTWAMAIAGALEGVAEAGEYETPGFLSWEQLAANINEVADNIAKAIVAEAVQAKADLVAAVAEKYPAAVAADEYKDALADVTNRVANVESAYDDKAADGVIDLNDLTGLKAIADKVEPLVETALNVAKTVQGGANFAAAQADMEKLEALQEELTAAIKGNEKYLTPDDNDIINDILGDTWPVVISGALESVEEEGEYESPINWELLEANVAEVKAHIAAAQDADAARIAANTAAAQADMEKLEALQEELTAAIKDNDKYLTPDDIDVINDILGDTWPIVIQGALESVEEEGAYESPINWEQLEANVAEVKANIEAAQAADAARIAANTAAAEADLAKLEALQADLTAAIKDNDKFLTPDDIDVINDILGDTWPMVIQGALESVEEEGEYESPINWEQLEANIAEVKTNIEAAQAAEAARIAANQAAAEADMEKLEGYWAEISEATKDNEEYISADTQQQIQTLLGDTYPTLIQQALDEVAEEGEYASPIDEAWWAQQIADINTEIADAKAWPLDHPVADGDYYLVNTSTGQFLNGANDWGTKASLTAAGQLMTLVSVKGGYNIDTHISNGGNSHYLGASNNTYVDANPVTHQLVAVEGEEGVYAILNEGKYFVAAEDGKVNFAGDELTDAAKWVLVTREEIIASMAEATAENPVDVTSLIYDQNFGRNNTYSSAWSVVTVNEEGEEVATNFGKGGDNANMNAEKWGGNSQTFNMSQVLEGLPNGVYELSVQGYYRYNNTDGNTNDVAAAAHADGTEVIYSYFYGNEVEQPLASIADEASVELYGKMPFSQGEASAAFGMGAYDNKLVVEVTDGTLKIGVKKVEHIGCDWTVWDNFRLTYLGEPTTAELAYTTSYSEDYSSCVVTVEPTKEGSVLTYTVNDGTEETTLEGNSFELAYNILEAEAGGCAYTVLVNETVDGNVVATNVVEVNLVAPALVDTDLTPEMFIRWDGFGAAAKALALNAGEYHIGEPSGLPYGHGNVEGSAYADLTNYSVLALTVTEGTPRLILNRQGMDNSGDFIEINSVESPYVKVDPNGVWHINLAQIQEEAGYVHLNCIKAPWGSTVTITDAKLYVNLNWNDIEDAINVIAAENGVDAIYDLSGRRVSKTIKGQMYIINGKKVLVNK